MDWDKLLQRWLIFINDRNLWSVSSGITREIDQFLNVLPSCVPIRLRLLQIFLVPDEFDQLANQLGWFHSISGRRPQRPYNIHEGLDLALYRWFQIRNYRVVDAFDKSQRWDSEFLCSWKNFPKGLPKSAVDKPKRQQMIIIDRHLISNSPWRNVDSARKRWLKVWIVHELEVCQGIFNLSKRISCRGLKERVADHLLLPVRRTGVHRAFDWGYLPFEARSQLFWIWHWNVLQIICK